MAPTVTRGVKDSFFDASAGLKINIAETLDAIDPRDLAFLSLLGWAKVAPKERGAAKGANSLSFPCTEIKHEWLNDELDPTIIPLTSAYTAGSGTLTFGTTTIKYLAVDDILMADDVQWRVTAVNDGAGTCSVVLLTGLTDANVASGTSVLRLQNATIEGKTGDVAGGFSIQPAHTYNYVQNFDGQVNLTFTEKSVMRYGIGDNEKREISNMLQSKIRQFELACMYNYRGAEPTTAASKPIMGGLYYYIRQSTPQNTNQVYNGGGAKITDTMLKTVCRAIYEAGGAPDTLLVSPIQQVQIDEFLDPYRSIQGFEADKYGGMVRQYRNSFFDGKIVVSRNLRPGDAILLSTKYLGVGPLNGHMDLSFSLRQLADRGNTADWYLSGSYTMEVRNNTRAHGWIHSLATS